MSNNTGLRKRRKRECTPPPPDLNHLSVTLDAILNRVSALEQSSTTEPRSSVELQSRPIITGTASPHSIPRPVPTPTPLAPALSLSPPPSTSAGEEVTERLIDALRSLNPVRSNHYYVSDFDPNVHDVIAWCDEVERAKTQNRWDDKECLARIGLCLKGESHSWLRGWTETDRTWSTFKLQLRSLCPRRVDVANILYDVMCTESDKYSTYAEYARKSLLRLRIVKGISNELLCAIIMRGIKDPQIRAAAMNAKLNTETIVEFLSIYVMPNKTTANVNKNNVDSNRITTFRDNANKRTHSVTVSDQKNTLKCYTCGAPGHKSTFCFKRFKNSNSGSSSKAISNSQNTDSNSNSPNMKNFKCNFCKKPGHTEQACFAKQRSESRNKSNVNFCREIKGNTANRDVTPAVLCGVPTDVLIDSGSSVSLISNELIKHFSCRLNPNAQMLRGIGGHELRSDSYVTLPIEFDNLTLEVDFHVVPGGCLSTPVIIGTDVLNRSGIAYIRTGNCQRICADQACVNNIRVSGTDQVLSFESMNTPLQGDDKQRLGSILRKYSAYFLSGIAASTVNTGEMKIRLTTETPVNYRPYKLSHDEKLCVRAIVNELKDKGVIRNSESSYASPILLVKKKDGTNRMVVDYRGLNSVTVKERYPLPLIEDHIDRLGKCKYFTALDMLTGFHQIKISDESIDKTAFVTPEGHFEYLKMPFGLANAPVVYQRIISETLKSFIDSGKVLVYIDDVLLLSDTVEEGLTLLDSVIKTLTKSGFSINLRKCFFLTKEVEYLGRTISNGQVRPSTHKIEALTKSPTPKTVKQVRQLLGLAGYFRRYIPQYATLSAPIAALTRKNVKFIWGIEQEKARQDVIKHLTSEPVLAIFDHELETEVHTDASSRGYGAVLLQTHRDGRKRAVAYFSKITVGAESRYHSYELETLAVVKALQHFRQYLIGKSFKIVTDCNALKMTQRKKDLLPRVARWWMYLQDYDFTLEYRKGVLLPHADYLSRNPVNVCTVSKPQNWAKIAQSADEETLDLLDKLQNGQLDTSRYAKRNDLLYYKYDPAGEQTRHLCYVPKAYRLSLLRAFHDEHEHIGVEKTCDLILKHFWFPGISKFVKKYISHCVVCITHKKIPRAPLQPIVSWQKPSTPFDTIHTDVLGPLPESHGYKYVLIIIDAFTKYCLLYPLYKQESAELKRVFTNAISLFGSPRLLVCDKGRMFTSTDFVSWAAGSGIELHFITPEMHQSNGQVERYCRTVLNMIRIETNYKRESWSEVLWKLQLVLNVTKQKTTRCSALNLLIGTESTTPVIQALVKDITVQGNNPNREAWRELHKQRTKILLMENQSAQDTRVNKNRSAPKTFAVDDLAYVIKRSQSTGKLDSGMRGPYRITKVLPNGRYELQLVAGSYGKTTQSAAEYMLPWHGEWTPECCAAFFECSDDEEKEVDGQPSPTSATPRKAETEVAAADDAPEVAEACEDAGTSGEAVLAASPTYTPASPTYTPPPESPEHVIEPI